MDPTYPLFPVFAFLGFVLPLIPLTWHFQAWNSGTCYYMVWSSLACLNQFVNSIVWAGNINNPAPVWCDISTRIMLGANVGLPAASLCINRRLYHIACLRSVAVTRSEKKRAVLVDSLICVLFPIICVCLQYIVEGHRFDIYEDIGCYPATYNTLPTYFLTSMWPIVIGLISATYCVRSLICLSQRRAAFSQFLASNKGLSISRYFRLMALAMTELIFTMPLAIFLIYMNTRIGVRPWISFADTHFDFWVVLTFPRSYWAQSRTLTVLFELTRWLAPVCSLIFFGFFGFAAEARRHYCNAFYILFSLD
ncbi:fungal pheromone STE3G-protein-coupled receptor [Mycena floridula]|nr:fungal pheromone STE3G-protein-coupled receptor [Mycena floridula]